MLRKKRKLTKKQLKKLIARMRMRRIQRIWQAIRIHNKVRRSTKEMNLEKSDRVSDALTRKIIKNKVKTLQGMISSSRKRARDRWTKRK